MIDGLRLACQVCESGASIDKYRHILFDEGLLRAYNGVVYFESPSDLEKEESFAVNEDRLATALTACEGEDLVIKSQKEFLVFKQKKLTVRVRKIAADAVFHARAVRPAKEARKGAGNLLTALRAVAPFVSSDASRPWSVSVLLRGGNAFATNNLSIARSSLDTALEAKIPAPAVALLCALPKIDWFAIDDKQLISVGCGRSVIAFPSSQGDWPDVNGFFKTFPKNLPELDEDLLAATKIVERFSDRFVSLNDKSVEGKSATIESEYEVEVKKGKGTYSARLLSLILANAKRCDFSPYPKPIYFEGDNLQGVAKGIELPTSKVKEAE